MSVLPQLDGAADVSSIEDSLSSLSGEDMSDPDESLSSLNESLSSLDEEDWIDVPSSRKSNITCCLR